MRILTVILFTLLQAIPSGKAFLEFSKQRDSVLVADQFEYGFLLEGVKDGTEISLASPEELFPGDTLALVRGWQGDTLDTDRRNRVRTIRSSVRLAPFEEGRYLLPPIFALRVNPGGKVDTLVFESQELQVYDVPVDTATFRVKELKPLAGYPVTFRETLPWIGGALLAALLIVGLVILFRRLSARRSGEDPASSDPAYIVALRKLEKYRGEKFWTPEKQKTFYSGITDVLKEYMERRYGFDAQEMTTAEVFDRLRDKDFSVPADLYEQTRRLFETADFVKFAKHTAPDEENSVALPLAIRFVMDTCKAEEEPSQTAG